MSRRQRPPPCCMVDLVDCFQDFVKKSLIFISLVVCTVAALLVYAVKLMLDRNRSPRHSVQRRVSSGPPGTQHTPSILPSPQVAGCPPPTPNPTNGQSSPPLSPICKEVLALINKIDCEKKEKLAESNKKKDECPATKPHVDDDPCSDDSTEKVKPSKKDTNACNEDLCKNKKSKKGKNSSDEDTSDTKKPCEEESNKKKKSANPKKKPSGKCKDSSDEDLSVKKKTPKKCKDICGEDSVSCVEDSSQKKVCCVRSISLKNDLDSCDENVCCLKRLSSKQDKDPSNKDSCCPIEMSSNKDNFPHDVKKKQPKKDKNDPCPEDLCCLERLLSMIDKNKDSFDDNSSHKSKKSLQCNNGKKPEQKTKNVKKKASAKEKKSDQNLAKKSSSKDSSKCSSIELEQVDPCGCPNSSALPPIIIIHNLDK
ncbi:uncharacterized protein isoform X3 [Choristoneura fumiferana]|uniref:uncharacterized protein isoform X3 n=1 Tax=Choristoneura fumiferana TaxID=7141 RepID=UPI003D15C161